MDHESTIRWFLERLSNVSVHPNGNQTIPAVGESIVEFDEEAYDNLGEFNTGTWTFTAVYGGFYRVLCKLRITTGAGAGDVGMKFYTTGAVIFGQLYRPFAGASSYGIIGWQDVELDAGETVYVYCENTTANNCTLVGGARYSSLSIARIPVIT